MKNPTLYYANGNLRIKFPNWTEEEVSAFRESLICWKRSKRELWAKPIFLAYREIKEVLPNIEEEDSFSIFWNRYLLLSLELPNIESPTLQHLYTTQREPTSRLASIKRALLMAPPRSGKTVMVATALKHICQKFPPKDIVVVAPLSLLEAWQGELVRWLLVEWRNEGTLINLEIWWGIEDAQLVSREGVRVILTSPQVILGLYKRSTLCDYLESGSVRDRFLILDESFLYQNHEAQTTIAVKELSTYFEYCWLLSGMPSSNFLDDLYSQINILYPTIQSYWKFVERYCLLDVTYWGTNIVGNRPGAVEKFIEDFKDAVIQCEYPENMSDWILETVDCTLGEVQSAIYEELVVTSRVSAATLQSEKPLTIKNLLTLSTRLLQVVSNPALVEGYYVSAKMEKLIDLLLPETIPALVWVTHKQTAKWAAEEISNKFSPKVKILMGETPKQERQAIIEKFQKGELDVLILHPSVGKYGHTLSAARTAFYLEINFQAEPYYQSRFRGRVVGKEFPIRLIHLLARQPNGLETIDHLVYRTVCGRSNRAQQLTVGEFLEGISKPVVMQT